MKTTLLYDVKRLQLYFSFEELLSIMRIEQEVGNVGYEELSVQKIPFYEMEWNKNLQFL